MKEKSTWTSTSRLRTTLASEKMEGLDNIYINESLKPLCSDFKGVFSCDSIPEYLGSLNRFSFVCNLSKEGEKGSHFVTIIARDNCTLYIDSLGQPCTNQEISRFINGRGQGVSIYSSSILQHPLSVFCGYYCIFNVLLFDANNSYREKFKFSNDDLYANDKSCLNYIKILVHNLRK